MHGVHRLHGKAIKQPVFDHCPGAGKPFFAGLEDQHRVTGKVAAGCQVARRAYEHRHMPVVSATVHHAGLGGLPGKAVFLVHGQRIHVGAQANGAPGFSPSAADDAHYAGLADAGVYFVHADQAEHFSDPRAGANLFKADFRIGVQLAPQRGQLALPLQQTAIRSAGNQASIDRH